MSMIVEISLGRVNGIYFQDFGIKYLIWYTFSSDWLKVRDALSENWYKERVCSCRLDGTSPTKVWSNAPPRMDIALHFSFCGTATWRVRGAITSLLSLKDCPRGSLKTEEKLLVTGLA